MTLTPERFYALLIGIDHYLPNPLYKNLKGAVRDVNLVADYCSKTFKLPANHLFKLISPNPVSPNPAPNPTSASPVPESLIPESPIPESPVPETLPTYENIVATFKKITELAQPGDQVYIHYSGHGGRVQTAYPEKGEAEHDEGLVPMDVGESGCYLRDLEIALLLQRMTDKGLFVTMVLDSCHSGGTTRGDCDIRGGDAVDNLAAPLESLVASREELVQNWRRLAESGADFSTSVGVAQSPASVVLAACRPSEYAYEYAVSGKERHGALTYWMIDTLTQSLPGLTYDALYDRVVAKIQSKFPQQAPMLSGPANRLVFGSEEVSLQYAITVLEVDLAQQVVQLEAGLAQGLSHGSRFALYPLGLPSFADPQQQLAIVEVTALRSTRATARILAVAEGGIEPSERAIEQGDQAVLLSTPVDLVRRVRCFDQKQPGDLEHHLPPELVNQQVQALQAVRDALTNSVANQGWVTALQPGDEQPAHYQVAVGRAGEYEICVGTPIQNLRPPLRISDPEAAVTVVNRLVHLAKYQAVQELDNATTRLNGFLEFELMTQPNWQPGQPITPQPFADPKNITVKPGETVFLRIKNKFSQSLNVAVLDLEPTWAVSQLPLQGINAPFYELTPEEEIFDPLQFSVPTEAGYETANETLKLFATLQPCNYGWLLLPALDQVIEKKRSLTTAPSSALDKLLQVLGGDVDAPPLLQRAAVRVSDPNQEWATQQIRLRIGQSMGG